MNITVILQFVSYFTSYIPLVAALIYLQKKRFSFDFRVNIIVIHLIFYFLVQNLMMLYAINNIHNSFIIQVYVPIEALLFSLFIFSFQFKSRKTAFILAISLSLIILLIDIIWGHFNELPAFSLMAEAITITVIGMTAIPIIKIHKDYESAFFYFIFGILFSSVNTLLGVGFIELAPSLSFNIQAIITITYHLIFTYGFYIILKSEKKSNN